MGHLSYHHHDGDDGDACDDGDADADACADADADDCDDDDDDELLPFVLHLFEEAIQPADKKVQFQWHQFSSNSFKKPISIMLKDFSIVI